MKTRFVLAALALLAVLSLCQCDVADQVLGCGAYAVSSGLLGPFAGPPPTKCSDLPTSPDYQPAGLASRPDGTCTATASDGACPACITAHCCEETLACLTDGPCTCVVGLVLPGIHAPEGTTCDGDAPAFPAELTCLSDHCAKECLQ
jgi:hypothetical protein